MGSCLKKASNETNVDVTPNVVQLKNKGVMPMTSSTMEENQETFATPKPTTKETKRPRKSRRTMSKVEIDQIKEEISNAIQKKDETKKLFRILDTLDDLVRQTSNDLDLENDLKQMDISIQNNNPNERGK